VHADSHGPVAAAHAISKLRRQVLLTMFAQLPGSAAWCVRQARSAGRPRLGGRLVATARQAALLNPELGQLQLAADHAAALLEQDPNGLAIAATQQRHGWASVCAAQDLAELVKRGGTPATGADQRARAAAGAGAQPAALSPRERQVADLVLRGLTNRQIATRLRCSPHTVNFHVRNIYRKLGIRSRVEIAQHLPITADQA